MMEFDHITSERIWSYPTDEIRLSMITNARFLGFLEETFRFSHTSIDHPRFRDGNRDTWPPGIVCKLGIAPVNLDREAESSDEVAFKTLQISANRIGVEVSGTTDYADQVFDYFTYLLSGTRTADGHPIIGIPSSVVDFSVIAMRHDEDWRPKLFNTQTVPDISEAFGMGEAFTVSPELRIGFAAPDQTQEARTFLSIKPRYGTTIGEFRTESSAMLASDSHRQLLERLFGNSDQE